MKNKYLNKIYNEVLEKNKGENEFIQAVYEFLSSLEGYIENNKVIEEESILERLVEPEKMISFRVVWLDDNNKVQVNRGYRVQFNSAIGPYKGGLRFHPTVNQSIIKFLGFEQILKNSLTGLPMGGGKGGSDFDPKGKSDKEIMRFCQSFMTELYRHIGPNTDVPAGDIGVGAREVGYLFGQYKKIKNEFSGVITGKSLEFGGSLIRPEATGYGLCYFTERMLKVMSNTSMDKKKVIISGSGNVALYALQKATMLGAKVIAMSDSSGYIYNENGIDFETLKEVKLDKKERIIKYLDKDEKAVFNLNSKDIWKIPCDIAFPCATQNEIDLECAKSLVNNNLLALAEGANMPCSVEATNYLIENKILYGPAKAANAGGVLVSGLEMSQNSMRTTWKKEEVEHKLKEQMENIFDQIYACAKKYSNEYDTATGANICGFEKVAKAMILEGAI